MSALKLIRMIIGVFLFVFIVALLLANSNSGQVKGNPSSIQEADHTVFITPYQAALIDSNIKQQPIKERLVRQNDSMMAKISKNADKVTTALKAFVQNERSKNTDTIFIPIHDLNIY